MTVEEQEKQSGERFNYPVNLPLIYTNGILVTLTVSDISLTITINGQATHLLNMSMTTAKTLVSNLSKAIEDFQEKTNTRILDIKEVSALMSKEKNIVE